MRTAPLHPCSAKGQQKKGQARMRAYDDLVSQASAYVKDSTVRLQGSTSVTGLDPELV